MYYELKAGRTNSCGCYNIELIVKRSTKPNYLALYKQFYSSYITGAKNRNLSFNLTFEEAKSLFDSKCFYCGCLPYQKWTGTKRKYAETDGFVYNGIDRLNNNIGYEKSNCVSCCGKCNFAKGSLSYNDWIQLIKSIYENLNLYKGSTTISMESTLQVNGDGNRELPILKKEDDIV